MKKITLILIFTIALSLTFGQQRLRVLEKYSKTERMGNFVTRWYYDIVGTSLIYREQLTLYSDSTYKYTYHGGECGTFDQDISGNWTMKDNILILNEDIQYKMFEGKLFLPETQSLNNQSWVMKKVK